MNETTNTPARAKEVERSEALHSFYAVRPDNYSDELRVYEKRPRHWDCWSAAEHEAWLEQRSTLAVSIAAWDAFKAQVPQDLIHLALEQEALSNTADDAGRKLIEARLKRLLPHYTDVITEAFDENAQWDQPERDPD